MITKRFIIIFLVLTQMCLLTFAQGDNRRLVRKGNTCYFDSMFVDAETNYRNAIKKNGTDPVAHFNLGNALLRERNPKDAAAQYEEVIKRTKNPLNLAKAYHNLGVIMQSQKQYKEAINSYENALRNNPRDNESRYNLALCKHLMSKEDQQGQENHQNEKEKRNDMQQNKPQPNDESKEQQKEKTEDKMSKENAERLLDVAKQEEQRAQEKLRKGQHYTSPTRLDKNW